MTENLPDNQAAGVRRIAFIELPDLVVQLLVDHHEDPSWDVAVVVKSDMESGVVQKATELELPVTESPDRFSLSECDRIVVDDSPELIEQIKHMMEGTKVEVVPISQVLTETSAKKAPIEPIAEEPVEKTSIPESDREDVDSDLFDARIILASADQSYTGLITIDTTAEQIVQTLSNALIGTGAKSTSIMLANPTADELRVSLIEGFCDRDITGATIKVGEGLAGKAFAEGSPQFVHGRLPALAEESGPAPHRVAASIPIGLFGRTVGVLNVNIEATEPLSEDEILENLRPVIRDLPGALLRAVRLRGTEFENKKLPLLRLIDGLMSLEETLPDRLDAVAGALCDASGAGHAYVHLVDPLAERRASLPATSRRAGSHQRTPLAGQGLLDWAMRKAKPQIFVAVGPSSKERVSIVCIPIQSSRPQGLLVMERVTIQEGSGEAVMKLLNDIARQMEELIHVEEGVTAQNLVTELEMRIADQKVHLDRLTPVLRTRSILEFAVEMVAAEAGIWMPNKEAQPVITHPQNPHAARVLATAWEHFEQLATMARKEEAIEGGPQEAGAMHFPVPYIGVSDESAESVILLFFSPDEAVGSASQVPGQIVWRVLARLRELFPKQPQAEPAQSVDPVKVTVPDTSSILEPSLLFDLIRQEHSRSHRYRHSYSLTRFQLPTTGIDQDASRAMLSAFLLEKKRKVDFLCETSPGTFVLLSPESEKGKEKIPQRFRESWEREYKEVSLMTEQRTFPDDGRDADAYVLWVEEAQRTDEAA